MIVLEAEQRSEEWMQARLGKFTASNADRLLSSVARETYALEVLAERLTGEAKPVGVTDAMQHGIDHEPDARLAYILKTGSAVNETGFCQPEEDANTGCSPDGLVGEDGLIEIKCPSAHNHLAFFLKGVGKKYIAQMQFQMMITGRKWCDFVSYSPYFQGAESIYIERIERDDDFIANIQDGISAAEKTIEKTISRFS